MRLSVVLLASLGTLSACSPTSPRQVSGVVVDEHGGVVTDARVVVGYHGWAWEPYLVWDHFYSEETTTDAQGRFQLDLTSPARVLATVETNHAAIRNVSVPAVNDLRLVAPATEPACRCWTYESPLFLTQLRIGTEGALSSANERQGQRLSSLPHRFQAERSPDNPRAITLTMVRGESGVWLPDDGFYGGLLDYHPPLDRLDFGTSPASVLLGQNRGLVALRTLDAYLVVQIGTGYATQVAGDDELLLLPARWAEPLP